MKRLHIASPQGVYLIEIDCDGDQIRVFQSGKFNREVYAEVTKNKTRYWNLRDILLSETDLEAD